MKSSVAAASTLCLLLCLLLLHASRVTAHNQQSNAPPCARNLGVSLQAAFMPGGITVDGKSNDWAGIDGHTFSLLQAINPKPNQAYPQGDGSMQIKVAHDGRDLFFLLEVPGAYAYQSGQPSNCASVALMFGVGDDATYYNMGGCKEGTATCSSSTCAGHEVDIMHFPTSSAIPGRLYGANLFDNLNGTGIDSFGSLNDVYAWNPHCRYVDGDGPKGKVGGALNDWRGSWTHSITDTGYGLVLSDSPYGTVGSTGSYTFEFARPLRTSDRLQEDAQFTIGGAHRFAAAFWYPVNGAPWVAVEHYSVSCDWVKLEILPGAVSSERGVSRATAGAIGAFSLLLSLAAVSVAVAVGWWVKSAGRVPFTSLPTNSL